MSRNSEVIFSKLPQINIQRSIFDIPQDVKTSFNAGELIPFYCAECLPSDSVKIRTNKVVRAQTLITPLMDNLYLDTFYFFVPNRIVWTHWKEFMGENTESAYLPETTYSVPKIYAGGLFGNAGTGTLWDYFGLPLADDNNGAAVCAFPFRGVWMIWNEFFRDQNLQDPININIGDSSDDWNDLAEIQTKPLPVNRLHDYFSSALKAPAKNVDGFVTAWTSQMNNENAPVLTPEYISGGTEPRNVTDGSRYPLGFSRTDTGARISNSYMQSGDISSTATFTRIGTNNPTSLKVYPDNLYADLTQQKFGITIPDLRQAFQMQKFLEREASGGSRYQELLLSHFSIRAQDSRLQRPEYLGGNRIPLNVSQIVNQSQADSQPLGDVGGMSLTTDSHFDVEYSCQEHGWIIGLCCVRYKNSFSQGYERMWAKNNRFDFAFPEFAHLTDQAVRNFEIYADSSDGPEWNNEVFGYQERYAEYKFKPNKTTGEMRPGITNSLASWHLGDYYTDKPYLSDGWLKVSKSNVDRALAVQSDVADQFFGDFLIQARWTRPLPVHSNPGFADHF